MSNFYNIFLKNGSNSIELFARNPLSASYALAFPSVAPSDNSVMVWDAATQAFEWVDSSGFATGTVTSVGLSAPVDFAVTNSPVVSSGNITLAWNNQPANVILASPVGGTGQPTFRALADADIPTISASKVSGQLTKANIPSGTIATTFQLNNNAGVIFSNANAGTALNLYDNTGAAFADLYVKNLFVSGSIDQTTTTTVNLGDSVLRLNSNFTTGTPSENAGLSVKRGSQSDADLLWIESTDQWMAGISSNRKPLARRHDVSIVNADLAVGIYTLNHNLGVIPVITVVDNFGEVTGIKITHTNTNTASLDFTRVGSLTGSWQIVAVG